MAVDSRELRAKLNIISSLSTQIITIICGLIVPHLLLNTFGSELYGATTSIIQFLSYISLLEGGIGGVARAELYRPLADNDWDKTSRIIQAIKSFFGKIGLFFAIYVFIIACSFKSISSFEAMDWLSTFALVIVISISTFGQYFIGISYGILLQADQKNYVVNFASMATIILNTLLVIFLINIGANLIVVKLVSSCVFVLRPVLFFLYVTKKYRIKKIKKSGNEVFLKDRWTGLGQHIAYFLHSNTDVVLLTLISNLSNVAVYSVYSLITSNMQSLVSSFGSGMEGLFGELYAKKEDENLQNTFEKYEGLLSFVSIVAFSTTASMILPFVMLYTKSVTDANYCQPFFAIIMVMAAFVYIIRLPYHNMVIAAGHFKQTRVAAYGEAAINIFLSITLVFFYGLIGVAIGTLVAVTFRFIYYVWYVSKYLVKRNLKLVLGQIAINILFVLAIFFVETQIINIISITNYVKWTIVAFITFCASFCISSLLYGIFFKKRFLDIINTLKRKTIQRIR